MAKLTFLDLVKRTNSDATIGLVEENLDSAPELSVLPIREITGTEYKITLRDKLPEGGFRAANEGVQLSSSNYRQKNVSCYFFDVQVEVDEALAQGDSFEIGDILTDEASGALKGSLLTLGREIYYGDAASKYGFSGFHASVDPSMIVDAKGTGNDTTTAWFVFESHQGVHVPVGHRGNINGLGDWIKQQVTDPKGGKFMAYVNNMSSWIGLSIASRYSLGCIRNITAAKPLTDALGAEMISKFPVGMIPTRCFMNRNAAFFLQNSRSAIGNWQAGAKGGEAYSPLPEEIQGVPIVRTDSIHSKEKALT